MRSSFLWPVYSAGVKNGPHICIFEEALNGRKKGSERILYFQGMETAQLLVRLNKSVAVVDVVSLDFSRLRLFQWCPVIETRGNRPANLFLKVDLPHFKE